MNTKIKRDSPYKVAEKLLETKFSDSSVAFVAGSFNRNEETEYSDIDLVVVYPKVDFAWRESFIFCGWPVEAFVHDPETLKYFFYEVDGKDGQPALPSMVLEGPAVPANSKLSIELKQLAKEIIENGPPKWNEEIIYHQRYMITDLIDDIRAPRNQEEANAVIGSLHEILGNFYFRANNLWSASRKHILRKLKKVDPTIHQAWIKSFDEAYRGQTSSVIELTEQILKPYGGFLFDGYRRNAPPEWRK